MVTGDDQHIGLLAEQDGQSGIEFLDGFDLGGIVAVFTVFIGVFEVDEEEVVIVVRLLVGMCTGRIGYSSGCRANYLGPLTGYPHRRSRMDTERQRCISLCGRQSETGE